MTPVRLRDDAPFRRLVGVGGIGTGIFLAVEGDATIGRTESRPARLLDVRDSCKLHDVAHHVATLLGAHAEGEPFHVVAVGIVGADEAGTAVVRAMAEAGIDVTHVRVDAARSTLYSVCFQYPNGDGGNLTTADSAADALTIRDVEAVAGLLDERTIALAQPEVPIAPRRRLLELATAAGAFRAASFTSLELDEARAAGIFDAIDLVSMNEHEAAAIAGRTLDPGDPEPFLRTVAGAFGASARRVRVVVTAGGAGAYAFEGGRWAQRRAPHVEIASTAGSGDALLAGVLAALAAGLPFLGSATWPAVDDAVGFGVLFGSLNATSPHTIHPSATFEVLTALADRAGARLDGAASRLFDREGV